MASVATFDIETSHKVDFDKFRDGEPLGISVAAFFDKITWPQVYVGLPPKPMTKKILGKVLDELESHDLIVTWNGCKFDFAAIALATGQTERVAKLCRSHCDLLFQFDCMYGKRLRQAGVSEKLGLRESPYASIDVPGYWQAGDRERVIKHCSGDVINLMHIYDHIIKESYIPAYDYSIKAVLNRYLKPMTVSECIEYHQLSDAKFDEYLGWTIVKGDNENE